MTAIGQQTGKLVDGVKSGETLIDFARWAAAQLGLEVTDDDGTLRMHLPEDARDRFGGEETVVLADGATVEPSVLDWLCDELRGQGPIVHTRPCDQPEAVSALAPRLFAAYQIDGGRVHLAGCRLEERPFLRFTFAVASDAPFKAVRHAWVGEDLERVPNERIAALRLDTLQPFGDPPPHIDQARLAAMSSAASQLAAQQQRSGDPANNVTPPLAAALVWAKYAVGQLQFTVGDQAVLLPFEGWARTLQPPPYVCPLSGTTTFHLAATDDGRIAPAEQIAACARSGRRVLAGELARCQITGLEVLPEFVRACPVTGEPVLHDQFVECPTCRQQVSSAVLTGNGCQGCSNPPTVPADDPRLASILGAHPELGRWRRWRLGETATAYIVRGEGLLRQMLVVLDRTTLKITHMARRGRVAHRWVPLPADLWPR